MSCILPMLHDLAAALPVPPAVLSATGVDTSGVAGSPPRSVADLFAGLAQRDMSSSGSIDVRILGYADGSRRVVVDITGMKSVNPFALHDTTQPLSAAQDMFGLPSTYEAGVLAAMRAAGVRSSDDVMLVGHSEGGMVAVNAARAAVASGEYRVTHVITAGSPIAITAGRVPSSVKVLALENERRRRPLPGRRCQPRAGQRHHGHRAPPRRVAPRQPRSRASPTCPARGTSMRAPTPRCEDYLATASGCLEATSVQTKTSG